MKRIIERVVIPSEDETVFAANRIIITLRDQAAGPYLAVEGVNDEPDESGDENQHEFYFCTVEEIDEFAQICRELITQYDYELKV